MEGNDASPRAPGRDARTGRFRAALRPSAAWPLPLLVALVPLLVHLPVVAGLRTLYFNDVTELHVPIRTFFGQAWAQGRFPLWCPGVYLGFPLFAEGQAGPLYPPNWPLFALLPAWWGVGLSFALHLSFAGLGTFAFLRRFVRPTAAAAGGLAFALCGHFAMHHMHLNLVQALSWLPWCLAAAEALTSRGRARDLAALALALGLMALCGHPQSTVQGLGATTAWMAVRLAAGAFDPGTGAARARAAAGAALALALGTGLWMVQVLPALELVEGSVRSGAARGLGQMGQHLSPQALAATVVPGAFGTAGMGTSWLFPGGSWRPGLDLYLGAAVPFLAVVALLARRDRWTLAVAACALAVGLSALGPLMPGVQTIFRLPGLRGLRFPDRLLGVLSLALAVLAAAGLDGALAGRAGRRRTLAALAAVVLPVAAVLAWTYGKGFGDAATLRAEVARDGALAALALAAAAAGVLLAARRPRLASGLVLAAVALPLAEFHARQVPTADPAVWDLPVTAAAIRDAACAGRPDCPPEARLDRVVFRNPPAPYLDIAWLRRPLGDSPFEGLAYNLPLAWGLPAVDGILPLRQQAFLDVYKPLHDRPGRSLGVLGGRFVVTPDPKQAPKGARPLLDDGPVRVFQDPAALPRAFAVHRAEAVADPARAAARVAGARDLRRVAVLDEPLDLPWIPPARAALSQVDVVRHADDEVVLDARMEADGLVVLAEAFAPGWAATVDGAPSPILRADHVFRAVRVPEGHHRVRFAYRPAAVYLGGLLSASALALLVLLLLAESAATLRGGFVPAPFAGPPDPAGDDDRAGRRVPAALILALLAWLAVAVADRWDLWRRSFERFGG